MRRLLVMRHGKSDWSVGAPDHDRPLKGRGRRAADAMGRLLSDIGEAPDHVITSSAVRARTTAQRAAAAGAWQAPIEVTDALYHASVEQVLRTVADAPDVERLLVAGHEPTWSALVAHLTGGDVAMKTATVAAVDLHARAWPHAPRARGELAWLFQPRHFHD